MSDTVTIGCTEYSKLDDYLNKIDKLVFEITDDTICTFNNAFGGITHIHVLSSSRKDEQGRAVFDNIPPVKIVKDPETGTYQFETDESTRSIKWTSPDGLFSFMILDNKYFQATVHGTYVSFMTIVQDYEDVYGSLVSTLLSFGISGIFINLDK